jgi:hypothetical protein
MDERVQFLLEQSAKCRRLAAQTDDDDAKQTMLVIADDYRLRAAKLYESVQTP